MRMAIRDWRCPWCNRTHCDRAQCAEEAEREAEASHAAAADETRAMRAHYEALAALETAAHAETRDDYPF